MPPFKAIINVRIPIELKARLLRLVRQPEHRGRDLAALGRIALEDYCDAQEKKLGLPPIKTETRSNPSRGRTPSQSGKRPSKSSQSRLRTSEED